MTYLDEDKKDRSERLPRSLLFARNDKEDQIATPASTHWRTRNEERRLINQVTTSAEQALQLQWER